MFGKNAIETKKITSHGIQKQTFIKFASRFFSMIFKQLCSDDKEDAVIKKKKK